MCVQLIQSIHTQYTQACRPTAAQASGSRSCVFNFSITATQERHNWLVQGGFFFLDGHESNYCVIVLQLCRDLTKQQINLNLKAPPQEDGPFIKGSMYDQINDLIDQLQIVSHEICLPYTLCGQQGGGLSLRVHLLGWTLWSSVDDDNEDVEEEHNDEEEEEDNEGDDSNDVGEDDKNEDEDGENEDDGEFEEAKEDKDDDDND